MTDTTSEQTERKLLDELYADFETRRPDPAVDPGGRPHADVAAARRGPAPVAVGRSCCPSHSAPESSYRWDVAASAAPWPCPTPACRAVRTPPRPCGPRSSTWARARSPPRTGTARAPSGSSSKARACGPTSTATRSRCGAATCCSRRAGPSTSTRTSPTSRWPGSTASTSRSSPSWTPASSSSAPTTSPPVETPERSRGERLWGHPGLRPIGRPDQPNSPLGAYRWEHTDAALTAQLELEDEGVPGVLEPGHAGVRFSNPTTGRDALVTHAHRDAPTAGRRTDRPRAHGRLRGLAGVRGAAVAHVGDKVFEMSRGRPVRRPVLVRGLAVRPHPGRPVPFQRRARLRGPGPRPHRPRRTQVKLATIRVNGTTRAVRRRRGQGRGPGRDRPGGLPAPRRLGGTGRGRRRRDVRRRPGLRPGRRRPGEDRLRRPQLPHPHSGDGPRTALAPRRCSTSSREPWSARTTT